MRLRRSLRLNDSAERMRNYWNKRTYPELVYVETTNFCNARCTYCLYDRMERPVEQMSQREFQLIVDKVEVSGIKIGAMFCFGEPLADKNLFEKIRYGRERGVMSNYLGLNTNCQLLTSDRYWDILENCSNITLSFVNTGGEFEDLTGLDWDICYNNAIKFIKYRDEHAPEFKIQIGCNEVTGFNREAVELAFKDYTIDWARDAEIKWNMPYITGVIDRSIMYHQWKCDGHNGALQIKPNGDCCFCAYDVIRSETKFANIFLDTWETIETNFKQLWQQPSSFCLRCDYWWNYWQMVKGGWKRGKHIDSSWQQAYDGKSIYEFWEDQHGKHTIRYLSNYSGEQIWKYLELKKFLSKDKLVLNVGIGTGRGSLDLQKKVKEVWGLDISRLALESATKQGYIHGGFDKPEELPSDYFDLAISHLVAQHMTDLELYNQIKFVLRSLKPDGRFAIQFAAPALHHKYEETLAHLKAGTVWRDWQHMTRLIEQAGGKVVHKCQVQYYSRKENGVVEGGCAWEGYHIQKGHDPRKIKLDLSPDRFNGKMTNSY